MFFIQRIFSLIPVNLVTCFGQRCRCLHIIMFACFFFSSIKAGAWQNKEDVLQYDSSTVQLRNLPDSNIKSYRTNEEFNYSIQRSEGVSIWDRFWYWVFRKISDIQANKFWAKFFEVLIWIFCISAFVYAALKLTGMNSTALFATDKKNDQLDYLLEEDNIYAINFPEAIQVAIQERNFRVATRLLYLQSLRKLADAELITWKINKTNDVYLHELSSTSLRESFGFLTRAYEYAWYGAMPLEEALFKEIHQQFINFNNNISA